MMAGARKIPISVAWAELGTGKIIRADVLPSEDSIGLSNRWTNGHDRTVAPHSTARHRVHPAGFGGKTSDFEIQSPQSRREFRTISKQNEQWFFSSI